MRLLNKYVLREWLISFVAVYLIVSALLLLEDVYNNFYFFIKAGVGVTALVKYSLALSVTFIPLIVPIVLFISTLFSFSRLRSSNEIIAMQCNGSSILQISKPVLYAGVVISAISLLLEIKIIPISMEYVNEFRISADSAAKYSTKAHKFGFRNNKDKRMWVFSNINKMSLTAEDICISCFDNDWNETKRIFSESAKFDKESRKWTFYKCSVAMFDKNGNISGNIQLHDMVTFNEFYETPQMLLLSLKKPKYLSFSEVKSAIKLSETDEHSGVFFVKFHKTFSNFVTNILVLALAIPFATTGIRIDTLTNTAKASILLILFFVLNFFFEILGNNGKICAVISAWLGNIVLTFPIIYFFRKSI